MNATCHFPKSSVTMPTQRVIREIIFGWLVICASAGMVVADPPPNSSSVRLTKVRQLDGFSGEVETIVASPDGKWLAIGWKASGDVSGGAQIVDARTMRKRSAVLDVGQGGSNTDSAFTPDSRHLVTLSYRSMMRIWDAKTAQQVGQADRESWDWQVRCHSNNQECVTTGGHPEIRRWEIPSGKMIAEVDTPFDHVLAMDLSVKGDQLAIMGRQTDDLIQVQIRSYPDLMLQHEYHYPSGSGVHARIAISPDGRRFVCTTADGTDGRLYFGSMDGDESPGHHLAGLTRTTELAFLNSRTVICHGWRRSPVAVEVETGRIYNFDAVPVGGAGLCVINGYPSAKQRRLLLGHGGDERDQGVSAWHFPRPRVSTQPTVSRPASESDSGSSTPSK